MYINVYRMLYFPWSLALQLGTTLFIAHMLQATCLDHPNSLYYHNIALIETSSLNSWPNNRIYGENGARKAYQLNLYPIPNHDSSSSQSLVWPFSCPYFCKVPHLTIYTICSTNMLSINAYVAPSLLWLSNGTNTNHSNKCSIITKTY